MNQDRLMKVLLAPHITEKSNVVAEKNRQFAFKVLPNANKLEVKKAVESLFNVKVDSVRVANFKGKKKRFGAIESQKKSWKKAYVSLKEGHDIDYQGQN